MAKVGNTRSSPNYNPFKKAAMNMQSIVADDGIHGDIEKLRKLKAGGKRGDKRNAEAEPEPMDTQEHLSHGDHLVDGEKRPKNPIDHQKSSPVQPNKIGGDMEEQAQDEDPGPTKTPEAKARQLLNRSGNTYDSHGIDSGEDPGNPGSGTRQYDQAEDSHSLSAVERMHRSFGKAVRDKRTVTMGSVHKGQSVVPRGMKNGTAKGKTKSRETSFFNRDKQKNYENDQ